MLVSGDCRNKAGPMTMLTHNGGAVLELAEGDGHERKTTRSPRDWGISPGTHINTPSREDA
jgi:hypothetical protein